MAQETLQTRQKQGDTCAHHDGPGPPQRAVGWAPVLRRALVVAQTPPLCGALWPAVWAQLGSKRLRWERMRAWFAAEAWTAMGPLGAALFSGCTTSRPLVVSEAASSPALAAVTSCPPTRGSPMLGGGVAPPGGDAAACNPTPCPIKAQKSPHKTAMAGRHPHRAVRSHGRIGFTSHQRELLFLGGIFMDKIGLYGL